MNSVRVGWAERHKMWILYRNLKENAPRRTLPTANVSSEHKWWIWNVGLRWSLARSRRRASATKREAGESSRIAPQAWNSAEGAPRRVRQEWQRTGYEAESRPSVRWGGGGTGELTRGPDAHLDRFPNSGRLSWMWRHSSRLFTATSVVNWVTYR